MNPYLIVFNLFFLMLCNQSCQPSNSSKKQDQTKLNIDTSTIENHWKQVKKHLIGLDSIQAWHFIWNSNILLHEGYDYTDIHEIVITKKDLNFDKREEYFLTINQVRSFYCQENTKNKWEIIWSGYEDGGHPPKLVESKSNWIKSYHFMSCSNCSSDGVTFHKICANRVDDLIYIAWGYNFDYETKSGKAEIYEQANSSFELRGDSIIADFDIEFHLLGSEAKFLKDSTVQIIYELDEKTDSLKILNVSPSILNPYFLKWLQIEKEHYKKHNTFNHVHHSNSITLLAFLDMKKSFLIQLKRDPKFKKDIEAIEKEYNLTWDKFIANWLESSWASRNLE